VKKVLKDILIALDRDYMMAVNFTILDERQLIDELRDFLKDKRYTYNRTPSNPTVLFMIP
jgi:disease resistance protein RPM1